jgi:hypothetical protein
MPGGGVSRWMRGSYFRAGSSGVALGARQLVSNVRRACSASRRFPIVTAALREAWK